MAKLTLEQLKKVRPEDLEVPDAWTYPEYQDHLRYLLENHPELVKELFQKDRERLDRMCLRVVQRATLLRRMLELEGNLDPDQIEEHVQNLVNPPDGPASSPNPPPELPEEELLPILGWAQNPH